MKASSDQHWIDISKKIEWINPWKTLKQISFHKPVQIGWYLDGKLNASANCIDRHLKTKANDVALIFEPDQKNDSQIKVTYKELHENVCRLANVLKKHGVQKGDRVTIYLPMILEATYAMLACARIGAVHSVVFGGFSADSLAGRIEDCDSKIIITANESVRGGKNFPLKHNVDLALQKVKTVEKVIVVEHTQTPWTKTDKDLNYTAEMKSVSNDCEPVTVDSEDPLFILYTSGSTGKPKGVLHTTGGYLTYVTDTFQRVFNYHDKEVFWCTADVGWVTGHSYVVYGPLSSGATVVIFEGVPNYPTPSRFWDVVDKHKVNIIYTAPTAIRALMKEGLDYVKNSSRKSLRVLGTVGEPINPEAWNWYSKNIGEDRCPVVDTWWQTETGGILISPIAGETKTKPGSATKPLPGIDPIIVTSEGKVLEGPTEGILLIQNSWPGQMKTIFKDHERFEQTYFSTYPGFYFTGDGCRRDEDGYYWITGRVDDVINVAGHRIGTAELESAFVSHKSVAEAAVVAFPHDIKGQGIYAYITLKSGEKETDELKKELIQVVRTSISPIATPDKIQWVSGLPKTRSGKIMRRILRKIAEGHFDQLGDTSTLADPSIVEELIKGKIT